MTDVENQLKAIYDKNGLNPSANRLYELAKKQGLKVPMTAVKAWISRRPQYIEHAPNTLDRKKNAFRITDVPNSYAVDAIVLKDFNPDINDGYRGFLLFVELTTRKAYAYPFHTGSYTSPPTGDESLQIFKRFEADTYKTGHPIARISGDNGKELSNALVSSFLHSKDIMTYTHNVGDHRANGILNRVVRSVRSKLQPVWYGAALKSAVADWNDHTARIAGDSGVVKSPDDLWDDKDARQNIRESALRHNNAVWSKTHYADNEVVKRYLRKGGRTKGGGLYGSADDTTSDAKEGKTYTTENFKVGQRQGYSHQLLRSDGSILKYAYRPYEIKRVPTGLDDAEVSKYQAGQAEKIKQQEAAKAYKKTAEKPVEAFAEDGEFVVLDIDSHKFVTPSQTKKAPFKGRQPGLFFHARYRQEGNADYDSTIYHWQPLADFKTGSQVNRKVGEYVGGLTDAGEKKRITALLRA
jgi:hypothetical protein